MLGIAPYVIFGVCTLFPGGAPGAGGIGKRRGGSTDVGGHRRPWGSGYRTKEAA
jgi:hypothetical protein